MGYVENMLGEHEELVFRTHQHWMTLMPSLLTNLVLALVIVVATALVMTFTGAAAAPLLALLVAVPLARFVYHFLLWDNTEYIVTNRRVIQIDGIVNKNVTDSSLEKVNDVKMSQSVIGRMLDYGDVEILTASELGKNLFRRIASPIKFKTVMLNQKEAMGGENGVHAAPGEPDTNQVPHLIAGLDALRKQGLITDAEFEQKKQELLARI